MMIFSTYEYEVIIVGGCHAGTEAALAAAHLGVNTHSIDSPRLKGIGQHGLS